MKLSLRSQGRKCYQVSGKMKTGNYRVFCIQGTYRLIICHWVTFSVKLGCSPISACRMALCAFLCGHSQTHPSLPLCSSLTPYFYMLKITRYWEELINIHNFKLEFNDRCFIIHYREDIFKFGKGDICNVNARTSGKCDDIGQCPQINVRTKWMNWPESYWLL